MMKTILRMLAVIALGAVGRSKDNVKLDLKEFLEPGNTLHDRGRGVSLTYPAGWEVTQGRSYPQSASTTFWLRPLWPSEAAPSFYYRQARPNDLRWTNPASFLEQSRKHEADRQATHPGYRIDPKTVVARTIAGRPAFSYVATHGERKTADYNLFIVGEKVFVGLYATGPLEDVLAIRSEIDRMAETVQLQ